MPGQKGGQAPYYGIGQKIHDDHAILASEWGYGAPAPGSLLKMTQHKKGEPYLLSKLKVIDEDSITDYDLNDVVSTAPANVTEATQQQTEKEIFYHPHLGMKLTSRYGQKIMPKKEHPYYKNRIPDAYIEHLKMLEEEDENTVKVEDVILNGKNLWRDTETGDIYDPETEEQLGHEDDAKFQEKTEKVPEIKGMKQIIRGGNPYNWDQDTGDIYDMDGEHVDEMGEGPGDAWFDSDSEDEEREDTPPPPVAVVSKPPTTQTTSQEGQGYLKGHPFKGVANNRFETKAEAIKKYQSAPQSIKDTIGGITKVSVKGKTYFELRKGKSIIQTKGEEYSYIF